MNKCYKVFTFTLNGNLVQCMCFLPRGHIENHKTSFNYDGLDFVLTVPLASKKI